MKTGGGHSPQLKGKYIMSDVQVIKLISGEEVIGSIKDIEIESRQLVELKSPAIIILMPQEDNPDVAQVGLAPWCPYADKQLVHVMPSSITAVITPKKELLAEYNKLYGSRIITAKKDIVT